MNFKLNTKNNKKNLFDTIFLLFIMIFVFFVIKILFPLDYLDLIKKYSHKYNLKPELICAIIHTESKFKISAVSNKQAKGLMQIRKSTADWGAQQIKIIDYDYKKIFEPEINIQIGCWYINNLIKQFNNIDCAICAYNAGSGNVSSWLKNKKYSIDGHNLQKIPFGETKRYLKRVKQRQIIYKLLFFLLGE